MARHASIRARLFAINPNCCYCGEITINRKRPHNERHQLASDCTLEHLLSRWNGKRSNKIKDLAIACYSCNTARGQQQEHEFLQIHGVTREIRGFPTRLLRWGAVWARDMEMFDRF